MAEEFDLMAELGKATRPVTDFTDVSADPLPDQKKNQASAEFADHTVHHPGVENPVFASNPAGEGAPVDPTQPAQEQPAPKVKPFMNAEQGAKFCVATVDALQTITFQLLIKRKWKKRFTEQERQTIQELNADSKNTTYTEEQLAIMAKFNRYMEQVNSIPFSETERDQAVFVLKQTFDYYGIEVNPVTAMVITTVQIFGPRLTTMFLD